MQFIITVIITDILTIFVEVFRLAANDRNIVHDGGVVGAVAQRAVVEVVSFVNKFFFIELNLYFLIIVFIWAHVHILSI